MTRYTYAITFDGRTLDNMPFADAAAAWDHIDATLARAADGAFPIAEDTAESFGVAEAVTEGDLFVTYAPAAYDYEGFGTVEVGTYGLGGRIVFVPAARESYQIGRYRSGGYHTARMHPEDAARAGNVTVYPSQAVALRDFIKASDRMAETIG